MTTPRTSPCLAHYGATMAEPLVADDRLAVDPPGGGAAEGLAFLGWLGFEPLVTNLYPRVGRQWILRRGQRGEPGYLERDLFTSFRAGAIEAAGTEVPRVGDCVFRLPVADPAATWAGLAAHGWATPYLGATGRLFRGPDVTVYELAPLAGETVSDHQLVNRTISIWTDPARIEAAIETWTSVFGLALAARDTDFHGVARATVLQRTGAGALTLQLLTPNGGAPLAERITDDIFAQEGYAHFRLGAPDKEVARAAGVTVFPDTGDVSYVLVEGAYLELVDLVDALAPA